MLNLENSTNNNKYFEICVVRDIDELYTYSYRDDLQIGQIVVVNFRNQETIGIIVSNLVKLDINNIKYKIKNISDILPYQIREEYIKFAKFISEYNLVNFGKSLKLIIPFSVDMILKSEKDIKSVHSADDNENIKLSQQQINAVNKISNNNDNVFKVSLLHGITGSGKTEVFLEIARKKILENKQVLILVPEISLSNELAKKIAKRCNTDVFIWHNSISTSKKLSIWKKALNGDSMIVVGARSSLFIPFKNLGLIVVDEEHDGSFKQNESVIYNARDMSVYLALSLDISIILSSATPSIESYNNAIHNKKYEYIKLDSRYHENAKLPDIYIDDLRKEKIIGALSEYSINQIKKCLSSNKQALIFVNRRGHTPKVICKKCGWTVSCPACSSFLCYHYKNNEFMCHYCGFKTYAKYKCEECNSEEDLIGIGYGIEKVYEECKRIFSNAKIEVLSSDTMNTHSKISKSIDRIKNHEIDIILGTQIVAKGHNFNKLNLVVISCIDSMLYGEDFRSFEKAFQMIYQVSGRAGRIGDCKSKVIIQTYNPDDSLMKIIANNDLEKLYENEIYNRKLSKMPPFGKIANITISALSEKEVNDFAKILVKKAPISKNIKVLGPIQPVIYKLKSRYRLRILVLSSNIKLQDYIKKWIFSQKIPNNIRLSIDIDPYDFC